MAVDESNGDLLVAYQVGEEFFAMHLVVEEFEPSPFGKYTLTRQMTRTPAGALQTINAVAVDSSNGEIYVAEGEAAGVIDHFSSEGVYLGQLTGTPSGPFGFTRSVAVDPVSGNLFVSDDKGGTAAVDIFGPTVVVPDVTTSPALSVGLRRATLGGTVNPDEAGAVTCQFEWGTNESFGHVAPCSETVANGHSPVAVHAEVTGLLPDTTYYYRLQASNGNGTNPGEASQDHRFTTLGPPIVKEPSASSVTSTSATLEAEVNSNNSATSYYFEYGTSTSYGSSIPAPPGAGVGSGEGFVGVSVHLQGLSPGTTYHYRVIVVNEPEGEQFTAEGPDETFTTQAAGTEVTLPDGRAWEMVSPPNKQGADIIAIGNEQGADTQAAAEGGGITYTATASFVANPAGNRSIETTQVISNRHAPGSWGTADITTPHDEGPSGLATGSASEYKLFSSDLSLGLVEPAGHTPLPPLPPGSEKTIYFRAANGEYKALVTSANVPPGTEFGGNGEVGGGVQFVSGSPDLSHVVVKSTVALVEGAPAGGGLYEWSGGQLQPVNVLPKGELTSSARLGDLGDRTEGDVKHAISDDGSRIVWEKEGSGRYYLRDMVKGETVAIDAAQGAPEPVSRSQQYWTADGEGSRVFFTSSGRLTANSTASAGGGDLYVFEVTSGEGEPLAGRLTDLTVDGNAGESAGVHGVIGASEDGSYVYFVASGVLGDGAEHGAERGGNNLYMERYDDGAKAWLPATFVAALSGGDGNTWGSGGSLKAMTSRVSPNGRYLTFMSERSLTGYENRDANSGVPDEEVFVYDAGTGRVVCASCDPTGARPVGLHEGSAYEENLVDYAKIWQGRWFAANIPGWTTKDLSNAIYQSRYLSDSGRLFFNSSDALVPADVNGREDVYEYEPAGVGSCQGPTYGQSASVVFSEGVGGCVALISSGTSSEESAFMDASETGGDVFFITLSKLAPQDYDTSIDMYDAHECTASAPCAPPPPLSRPPCTTGDACKAAPTPQPTLFGAPSSETFSGAGNVTPSPTAVGGPKAKSARCRRGYAKRHGVCLKRKPVKSKRAGKTNRRGK